MGLDRSVIFLESSKVNEDVADYLKSIDVERRDYIDLWSFLRRREWGEGKVSTFSSLLRLVLSNALVGPHITTNVLCNLLDAHPFPIYRRPFACGAHDVNKE